MAALRPKQAIKATIEAEGQITRQDVYELLKHAKGKTVNEKKDEVREFINSLPANIKNEKKRDRKTIDKIMDDLDSYPI